MGVARARDQAMVRSRAAAATRKVMMPEFLHQMHVSNICKAKDATKSRRPVFLRSRLPSENGSLSMLRACWSQSRQEKQHRPAKQSMKSMLGLS